MPRTPALDARGLRHRKLWPELNDDARELLFGFLGYWRAVAEDAAIRSGEIASVAAEDFGSLNNAKWWAHAVRTIDWLLHRVVQRQQWMEIQLAQLEGRWKPPDFEPDTSSKPGPLDLSSSPGTLPAAGTLAGSGPDLPSKTPSRKPPRTPVKR